jgi:hypothetical protein
MGHEVKLDGVCAASLLCPGAKRGAHTTVPTTANKGRRVWASRRWRRVQARFAIAPSHCGVCSTHSAPPLWFRTQEKISHGARAAHSLSMPNLPSAPPPPTRLPKMVDISPNAKQNIELAHKKRREKDNERHLIAQIKELNKQLDVERLRKVEEEAVKKGAEAPKSRLIVVANRLPVTPRRARDGGEWRFDRSSGGLVSAFLGVNDMVSHAVDPYSFRRARGDSSPSSCPSPLCLSPLHLTSVPFASLRALSWR